MKILGIETSCDETAASIVENGSAILSNVVVSSLKEHSKYGGIIPEIASRKQLESIDIVVEEALESSKIGLKEVDAIAVTTHPGLIGSLLVGYSFARALSASLNIPLIEVDHIKAHIYANFLFDTKTTNLKDFKRPKLPAVGLVVSGGHTSLYFIKGLNDFKLIGHTLDDAAGEAFDKVARILKLGYPGGPIIDKLSQKIEKAGISFKGAPLEGTLNFSFSGIKTAVLYYYQKHGQEEGFSVEQCAWAFQDSVITTLVKKSLAACKKYNADTLLIGGGVAANSGLRKMLMIESGRMNIDVRYPALSLCIDNAAMIAGYGYHLK